MLLKKTGDIMKKIRLKYDVNIKKIVVLTELLILSLIIGSSIVMADTEQSNNSSLLSPELASLNPDFVKYQADTGSNELYTSMDEQNTGLVPSPVDLNHPSYTPTTDASIPEYYNLRTMGRVTGVKQQVISGTCWAFATYGSLESYLEPGERWDFSENSLKNMLTSTSPEGFDFNPNIGGDRDMSTAYLARWSGPVADSDDPYFPYSLASSENLPVQKHVQNVLFIPGRRAPLDINEIKLAIMNYGAMYTTMFFNNSSYSPTNFSYFYNGPSKSNHAVNIVGWDDNFNKNWFSKVPPGNGAFIVKNSWGSNWGDYGYFYVSYYDSNIGHQDNTIFTAESPDNYKYIYQYDPLGLTRLTGYQNPTGWCANVFTTKSNEILKAVSFYTVDSNCNYEIYIFNNLESNPINHFGPVFSKSGTISVVGYHTIPFDSGVQLKAGTKFSVVLKLTTPLCNTPIAIEKPVVGYSSKAMANNGESFISPDGITWSDTTKYYPNTNVCIKAFTDS
jgi:C1A family cysteine protease